LLLFTHRKSQTGFSVVTTHLECLKRRRECHAMLHKSNFRFRVGVPLFNALIIRNIWEYNYRSQSHIAEN